MGSRLIRVGRRLNILLTGENNGAGSVKTEVETVFWVGLEGLLSR